MSRACWVRSLNPCRIASERDHVSAPLRSIHLRTQALMVAIAT
jgi:hypothetical protein